MVWRRGGDSSKTREDGELVGVGAGDEESRVEGDAGRRLARRGRDRQQPYGAFEGRMEAQQRIWRRSRRDGWHLEPQSPYASPDFFDGLHAHIDRPLRARAAPSCPGRRHLARREQRARRHHVRASSWAGPRPIQSRGTAKNCVLPQVPLIGIRPTFLRSDCRYFTFRDHAN